MNEFSTSDRTKLSPAVEDYLKAIYHLQQNYAVVTTSLLAKQLNIAAPSVSMMLQKLATHQLVSHTPYHGVTLTGQGQRAALEVVRHHRLLELFLVEALGYSREEVHTEAEVLEHVLSEKLEARIVAQLGDPTTDPHGNPIPARDGTLPHQPLRMLSSLPVGSTGHIIRVQTHHPDHLQFLASVGLIPGAMVTIADRAPLDGPITVSVGYRQHVLDQRLAHAIFVGAPEAPSTSH